MPSLSREQWERISPYLDEAMGMGAEEQREWLVRLRARDAELAADLEVLLRERSAMSREAFLEGTAVRAPASLAGQTVGAYTLTVLLGQGGMGNVWLGRRSDGRFEGQAAVKLLNASRMGRSGEERFRREGSILARLKHPHIARLIDAGVSATGQPYLVLEYIEGEPIDRYCDEHRLDVGARIRLFLEVLSAVAHAHANLIVHRDIKPSNVLVGRDGQVRLLDFGIAKLLEEETGSGEATALTREGGRALTPEYAAPEQVTGDAITTATDVHALGILLYVLLCGRHPAGEAVRSPASLVRAIVDMQPPRLSDAADASKVPTEMLRNNAAVRATTPEGLRRLLKGDLDTIVAKALKKSPLERYASVTAFAEDLRRSLDHKPIGARPDTLAYRAGKFIRRHTRSVVAAGAMILILAALVGFYTVRLTTERDRARLEAEKATKVSELLSSLLTGADPYETKGVKEPTVREILDAGAARIEKELTGEPALQAEMLTVVGKVYQRLGRHEKAQALLEKAVATARRALGPEHIEVARSLNELGVLLREKGDDTAAVPILEEALTMRRKLLGNGHKDVAVSLVELARVYSDQGNDRRAEPLLRESLAIRRRALGEEDHETAVSRNDLALLLRRKGDLSGAESLFRQSLAIFRKTRGEEHPHVATILNNLGLIAADREDYAASEALLREALEMKRKTLGERHRDVASALINLARPLLEQGKYDEAASVLEEGFLIARPSLGDDHPLLAFGEIYLARVFLAQKDPARAEPLLRDALRIRQKTLPPHDWRIGVPKSILGATLTTLGRYEEAEALLLDAQRVLEDIPGAEGQEARATRVRLAALDRYKAAHRSTNGHLGENQ